MSVTEHHVHTACNHVPPLLTCRCRTEGNCNARTLVAGRFFYSLRGHTHITMLASCNNEYCLACSGNALMSLSLCGCCSSGSSRGSNGRSCSRRSSSISRHRSGRRRSRNSSCSRRPSAGRSIHFAVLVVAVVAVIVVLVVVVIVVVVVAVVAVAASVVVIVAAVAVNA